MLERNFPIFFCALYNLFHVSKFPYNDVGEDSSPKGQPEKSPAKPLLIIFKSFRNSYKDGDSLFKSELHHLVKLAIKGCFLYFLVGLQYQVGLAWLSSTIILFIFNLPHHA